MSEIKLFTEEELKRVERMFEADIDSGEVLNMYIEMETQEGDLYLEDYLDPELHKDLISKIKEKFKYLTTFCTSYEKYDNPIFEGIISNKKINKEDIQTCYYSEFAVPVDANKSFSESVFCLSFSFYMKDNRMISYTMTPDSIIKG